MSADYLRELAAAGTPAAAFIGQIVPVYIKFCTEMVGLPSLPTHDPSAMAFAFDPSLFRVDRVRPHVENEGRCAGQTVADRRRLNHWPGLPKVDVCVGVDSDRLLAFFRERVGG